MKEVTVNDVAFIIVLYKTSLSNCITFNTLNSCKLKSGQKINLIVYDNSPISQTVYSTDKIDINIYHHDKDNPGVSKAYNYGATIAKSNGFKWIVLLDQDTAFPVDFIGQMVDAVNGNPQIKLFAPIIKLKNGMPFSPSRYLFKRGHPVKLQHGTLSLKKYSPVNSGMAIAINTFLEVGGYIEQVTLDFADFQFIERFRMKHGSFYLFNSVAVQDFSNDETDLSKIKDRFTIYCTCGKNSIKYSFIDKLTYLYPVLRHTIGLFFKTKSLSIFKIAYLNYFK